MISQFGHTKHKSNLVRNLNSLVFKAKLALGKIKPRRGKNLRHTRANLPWNFEQKSFHVIVALVISLRQTSSTQ